MSTKQIVGAALLATAVAAGGGGWFLYNRHHDPMAMARLAQTRGDLREAAIDLRNAVREQPGNAEAHWRLGTVLLASGDPVAAEKELKTARDQGFDAHAILLPLAQSYLAQGKFEPLLAEFPTAQATAEQAPYLLVARASAELGLNRPEAAQASIEEAEKRGPQIADVAFAAARVAAARKDYALATQKVDRSLALNPHNADALFMKAELLNMKGDQQGALAALDAAIVEAPAAPQPRLARANLLMLTGRDTQARADAEAVLAANPKDPVALYLQAVLMVRAKDYAAADVNLQKLSALLPRIPRGYFFEAVTKFNLGQLEQAADSAARFLARNPSDLAGIKLLAQIDMASGRPDRAAEVLNRTVSAGHSDPEILDMLGRAYTAAGRPQQAVQTLERAVAMAPNNSEILTRLASTRLESGDPLGASSDYERSLALSPNQSGAGEAMVTSALAAGDINRALAALQRLRELKAKPELIGLLDGVVKAAQLDLAGARAAFDAVLKDDPKSVAARINLARLDMREAKPDAAEKTLNEALAIEPANEAALALLIQVLLQGNHVPQAVIAAETARKTEPGNVTLTGLLADLYIRAGDPNKALAMLDALPHEQAALPALLAARARVQIAMANPADARAALRQILTLTPGDIPIRMQLIDLLAGSSDMEGAKAAARDGLRIAPGNPTLLNAAVSLELKDKGTDAALAEADRLTQIPASMPAAAALRGNIYYTGKRYDDAAAAYAAALKTAPSGFLALDAAFALVAANHPDNAAKLLRDWLATHPDDMDVTAGLAGLDISARRLDDALPRLQAVLAKRPNDPTTLNNLAWVYQQKGDARARPLAQRSYLLSPSAQAADTLGWILTAQGDAAQGLPLLQQAISALSSDPEVGYHYAVALKDTGDTTDAVRVLKLLAAVPTAFDDKPAAVRLLEEMSPAKP